MTEPKGRPTGLGARRQEYLSGTGGDVQFASSEHNKSGTHLCGCSGSGRCVRCDRRRCQGRMERERACGGGRGGPAVVLRAESGERAGASACDRWRGRSATGGAVVPRAECRCAAPARRAPEMRGGCARPAPRAPPPAAPRPAHSHTPDIVNIELPTPPFGHMCHSHYWCTQSSRHLCNSFST